MEPKLVERIVADGDVIQRFEPQEWTKAVEPSTAADLTAMMELAVQSGTGVAAQIPGISVAGKTGTAESQGETTPGSSPSRLQTARRSPSRSPSPIRRAPAARRRRRSRAIIEAALRRNA